MMVVLVLLVALEVVVWVEIEVWDGFERFWSLGRGGFHLEFRNVPPPHLKVWGQSC